MVAELGSLQMENSGVVHMLKNKKTEGEYRVQLSCYSALFLVIFSSTVRPRVGSRVPIVYVQIL